MIPSGNQTWYTGKPTVYRWITLNYHFDIHFKGMPISIGRVNYRTVSTALKHTYLTIGIIFCYKVQQQFLDCHLRGLLQRTCQVHSSMFVDASKWREGQSRDMLDAVDIYLPHTVLQVALNTGRHSYSCGAVDVQMQCTQAEELTCCLQGGVTSRWRAHQSVVTNCWKHVQKLRITAAVGAVLRCPFWMV